MGLRWEAQEGGSYGLSARNPRWEAISDEIEVFFSLCRLVGAVEWADEATTMAGLKNKDELILFDFDYYLKYYRNEVKINK